MTERTTTLFTCDGCADEVEDRSHITAPHGWRKLAWNGGFVGDESREAHFCGLCCESRLRALDVLLNGKGKASKAK